MVDLNLLESSNVWKYIGMEIVENDSKQKGIRIKNSTNLKQVYGNVHGGIIAMAIDAAMGVAVNEAIGSNQSAVTVELKTNYLRPAFDSDIFAYAKIVKEGKTLLTGTVDVFDEKDQLIALGIVTYIKNS
jgi:uncharacterized protein (TIGR00369 family)